MKFAVLGAGQWGTTFASYLAKQGHKISIWAREKEIVEDINKKKINNACEFRYSLFTE